MELTDRQTKLLKLLAGSGTWMDNHALARASENVGRETLRKEIASLEELGLLVRGHGKVKINSEGMTREVLKRIGLLSKSERLEEIWEILKKNSSVRIASLAEIFHVTEATIRGDIGELLPSDRVKWQYGKVQYLANAGGPSLETLAPGHAYPAQVQFTADRAAQFVTFGDIIFLDSSDYSLCVLNRIPPESALVIFSDSLRIALLAATRGMKAAIHILGGRVDLGSLVTGDSCPGLESVTKIFAEVRSSADGSLSHRDARSKRTLESILPPTATAFFFLAPQIATTTKSEDRTDDHGPCEVEFPAGRVGEVILSEPDPTLAICAREGIPTSIAHDNHVVLNPLGRARRIGLATLDSSHDFSQRFINNLQLDIRGLPDWRFIIADNRMDIDTTLANLDLFVREKVELIIEYQHEHKLGRLIAERMSRAGIPILAIDIAIPGAYYFGANNYEAGRIAGAELGRIASTSWEDREIYLVAITDKGSGDATENRVQGMIDAFNEIVPIPERRIVILNSGNDSLSAEKVVSDQLRLGDEAAYAIGCVNENLAIGAIRALRQKRHPRTAIAAHNDSLELLKELREPESPLAGLVAYHPESYGKSILRLARNLLEGGSVPPAT
ncbi:MAG: substrate-binding domain-containing protein, partial [Spirochaetota bacterium]